MKPQYFSPIRNPMTVIALFVGLTELGLGLALPEVSDNLQSPLLYFMMGFASLVAVAFFIILYCRPHHFYSPTDYRSDESYLVAAHGILAQVLPETSEAEHDERTELAIPDSLKKRMTANLENPFCWYLLKVANKSLTIAEHTAILIREWQSAGKKLPPHQHRAWAFSGYIVAHTQTLDHLLLNVTFNKETDKLALSVSPDILRLLMHKVRPETEDSL